MRPADAVEKRIAVARTRCARPGVPGGQEVQGRRKGARPGDFFPGMPEKASRSRLPAAGPRTRPRPGPRGVRVGRPMHPATRMGIVRCPYANLYMAGGPVKRGFDHPPFWTSHCRPAPVGIRRRGRFSRASSRRGHLRRHRDPCRHQTDPGLHLWLESGRDMFWASAASTLERVEEFGS